MNPALAAEVETLVNLGWSVRTQTDTSASLEMRKPFNWWFFLLSLLLFVGIGAAIYVLYWLITSEADLFVRQDGGAVVISGDTELLSRQREEMQQTSEFQRDLRERGFWSATWPSLAAALVTILVWFLIIWGFVALIR